ncbi:N-acetylglucosamine kinase [Kosakonia oryzae]|uniref:Glucosamine kinase n=2 Tax=Kosakonia oryzae TaxID=497725 RepID=A0AA94GZJ6_9ENTR|nr:BadF/BadG/BcrA/BcrD ATPase family protein [Kosakonia oryzae]ANI84349.2 N-acetylglucosamine kinase [Kosakonia oryzae]UDJ81464.1 N-acetylglucosamine kinase [Kosakonia oryzae]SFB67392.1 glucosamine kinase [Kosakonia oryzae]
MQSLMLGIDGGGTRCRGRLTDAQGQLLAEARGGPANVWSHFEAAIDAIERVIDDLFTQAALPAAARAQTVLVAGLAGANVASVKARLESWQPVCQSRYVFTDVETACAGAHNGAPGAVFITGTGSQGAAWDGTQFTLLGGWGFALSDAGSGAVLGQRALRLALLAHEGIVPSSALTQRIMAHYHDSPEQMLIWSRQATPADWGRIVPDVFAAAHADDVHGAALVQQTAADIALMIQPLLARSHGKLALMGGLAAPIQPWLPADIAALLVPPQGDALSGALRLASQFSMNQPA